MDPHGYNSESKRPFELLVMRHPQTVGNVQFRLVGQVESPLTPKGEEQARRGAAALVAFKPQRIITSPLSRCRAITDPAAAELGIDVEVDEELIEMNFGPIEGLLYAEVKERGLCYPWDDPDGRWPLGDAEGMDEFMARAARCARKLSHYQGRAAVVTHGGIIRGLVAEWIGVPPEHFWQVSIDNVCSLYLEFDEEGNAFLKGLGLTPEQVMMGL